VTGPSRRLGALASLALAALLLQPLVATASYAGQFCSSPIAVPGDDCTAPDTVITDHPASQTQAPDATFHFTTDPAEAGDTFACKLDGAQTHDWTDCTTPPTSGATTSEGSKSYTGLVPGSYTFSVRATDSAAGTPNTDQTPATWTWTVAESTPPPAGHPETTITAGAERWFPYSFLGIAYSSDAEVSGWRCALNGEQQRCDDVEDGSRGEKEFLGMRAGDYVFTVAAVDTSDNVDPTPAKERWTVPMDDRLFKTLSPEWEQRKGNGYFQTTYAVTDERGAFIEQARQGFKSLVLVANKCPDCGKVKVYLKGTLLKTLDLSAPESSKLQVLPVASWRKQHSGRVRLVVASQGKDVVVDGLGFSRRR
jgi:hypothetical protein